MKPIATVLLSTLTMALIALPAEAAKLPGKIGKCSQARIVSITPRLEGTEFDSGTAVQFNNGGFQVSYDYEENIIKSRKGDRVRICLVSIPADCPPGDNRGRVYKTTNLRTKKSWELPDSQHSCGGA